MKMKKKNVEKDFSGCAEQPLWQRILITATIYLIKIVDLLLTLLIFFVFVGTIDDIIKYKNFYNLTLFCFLIICLFLCDRFANNKISFKIILILFLLSYWITYGVVLRYN